jgi:hypothetical protein
MEMGRKSQLEKKMIGTACGTVYKDGTIFLYSTLYTNYPVFTVAILGPGDAAWRIMKRILELPVPRHRCAVYHDGKVLLSVGVDFWYVLTRDGVGDNDSFARWDANDETKKTRDWNYVMESRGELLWVYVLAKHSIFNEDAIVDPSELSVTVHALEKGASGEVRWAPRDGKSLRDRVLFLGHPVSFAMDSSQPLADLPYGHHGHVPGLNAGACGHSGKVPVRST